MGYLSAEKKQELFGKYGKSNTDTGSPAVSYTHLTLPTKA